MASKTITTLYDDIDESTDEVRTVQLSFDGRSVEIDLGQKNYDKLAKALTPYLDAGRRGTGTQRSRGATAKSSDTAAIRAWAADNGIKVSTRGRIPATVVEQYAAAR